MSRKQNLEDIWQRFLITSDPYICSLRATDRKSTNQDLPDELQNLVKQATHEVGDGNEEKMDIVEDEF